MTAAAPPLPAPDRRHLDSAPFRVGFTGTRELLPPPQDRGLGLCMAELYRRGARVLHHGDCVGGDSTAHDIAMSMAYSIVVHPPEKDAFRAFREAHETRKPKGYWARNRDIVGEVTELVACPRAGTTIADWRRSGTWFTVRYAHAMGIPVHLIHPDGRRTDSDGADG